MNNALIIQKWIDDFDTNTSYLTNNDKGSKFEVLTTR